jgi:hypothetical protein
MHANSLINDHQWSSSMTKIKPTRIASALAAAKRAQGSPGNNWQTDNLAA